MTVLILAPGTDEHAITVAREIRTLGHDVRIVDLSAFPERANLTLRYDCCTNCGGRRFAFTIEGERLDLAHVGAIWWRRPSLPAISADIIRPGHRDFAANETQEALAGLWHALDAFWINNPARDQVAHRKAYQLRVAQDSGLRIPATSITNDPDAARIFIDANGYRNVICKSFAATEAEWRETRLLTEEELARLDNVRYAPVIFQEYISAVYDIRVTVVGEKMFAAAIHSQETDYPVDFRMDIAHARIEAVELPADVRCQIRKLMSRLDLVYGAIDLRLTPDGQHVFLEINPAGQWLFVENESKQPIAATLARLLADRDRHHEA
jgi:glutathione synthase/RimK-type ligase-like ATP-grasp enzyme